MPHRATAGEPSTTHGGAGRPDPDSGPLTPPGDTQGRAPGGGRGPRALRGGQGERLTKLWGRAARPRG